MKPQRAEFENLIAEWIMSRKKPPDDFRPEESPIAWFKADSFRNCHLHLTLVSEITSLGCAIKPAILGHVSDVQ
jgi:hypothetical protein